MIAESVIGAATELGPLNVPIVVRLQGTNSAEGLRLVSGLNLPENMSDSNSPCSWKRPTSASRWKQILERQQRRLSI